MEFRWIAIITLWTLLVGPVFEQPSRAHPRGPRTNAAARTTPAPAVLR